MSMRTEFTAVKHRGGVGWNTDEISRVRGTFNGVYWNVDHPDTIVIAENCSRAWSKCGVRADVSLRVVNRDELPFSVA
ncbi:MAG: hypothetical protein NUV53_03660 [Patescibacteria group bacterium]|nr:hypothetical protein [Patescibacteria group bacterium]